ncbi:hypothetical protein SAMN05892877_111228 [Rhizobium subbaraonis]|uniref:AlpA family transcriptional regulator n=1 Tax=Rhizobium subbaraonis TaxID=908946 RepID=A0A285UPI7_9HYPH|nr:hypothetical protein [Rhizobium subbaraonis]SOC43780.1 hypothetical protein SAMN05892877_111228 [Rhizobium subbaraonis]
MTIAAAERISPCPLPSARGLNRLQSAAYVGVSPSLFDEMVGDGRMPQPKRANARVIWDRRALDRAFDRLPGGSPDDDQDGWEFEV